MVYFLMSILFALFVWTQIGMPVCNGSRLFPIFRKNTKRKKEVIKKINDKEFDKELEELEDILSELTEEDKLEAAAQDNK